MNHFRAGAATSNVTPWLGLSISGKLHDRKVTSIHDNLHARCLVLDDGQTQIAIVVVDITSVPREVFDEAKRIVEEQTGLPATHVLTATTHTHSAPAAAAVFQSEPHPEYLRFLSESVADAVRRALENLTPARIGWGACDVPDFVFNRRWKMKLGSIPPNPFGKTDQVVMHPKPGSPDLIEAAGPVDPELSFLSVQHSDGKPIALLANYSLHYVGGVPEGEVSSDYYGVFARRIAQLLGADHGHPPFVGIMSNGTSGDVHWIDPRRPLEAQPDSPYPRIERLANRLAEEVLRTYPTVKHQEGVDLDVRQMELSLGLRLPSNKEVEAAARVVCGTTFPLSREQLANQNNAREKLYARETLFLDGSPASRSIYLQAVRIGDLAILAVPCEVFAATGLNLKQKSPFQPTFTIGLANGAEGYLPPPDQFTLGGYETWRARTSYLEVGAEPKIVEALLRLLEDLDRERSSPETFTKQLEALRCMP